MILRGLQDEEKGRQAATALMTTLVKGAIL